MDSYNSKTDLIDSLTKSKNVSKIPEADPLLFYLCSYYSNSKTENLSTEEFSKIIITHSLIRNITVSEASEKIKLFYPKLQYFNYTDNPDFDVKKQVELIKKYGWYANKYNIE